MSSLQNNHLEESAFADLSGTNFPRRSLSGPQDLKQSNMFFNPSNYTTMSFILPLSTLIFE